MADQAGVFEQLLAAQQATLATVTTLNENFVKFMEMVQRAPGATAADGGTAGAAAGTRRQAANGAAAGTASAVTLAEVKVIAQQIVDHPKLGRPKAIEFILSQGAKTLAELDPAKYPAFIAAAQVLLAKASAPAAAEPDPLDAGGGEAGDGL